MYVKGNEIPPNAVVWGDDNGRPLYVCRSFYEVSVRLLFDNALYSPVLMPRSLPGKDAYVLKHASVTVASD